MTDTNKKVLELISSKHTIKEISRNLGISEKQLYIRIKQIIKNGYILRPSYYINSDIYYELKGGYESNRVRLEVPSYQKSIRFLIVSDLHIGNCKGDMSLAYKVYDYAVKHDINVILFLGDMIEGDYTTDKKSIKDINGQVEMFIKKYPYDKNIINIGILGNHEYHYFPSGLDIRKMIKEARYDIVPIGYGSGTLDIQNDTILLKHRLNEEEAHDKIDSKLIFQGHGHMMKYKVYDKIHLCAPTLSYKYPDVTKDVIPGFVDVTINLVGGKFDYLDITHMEIGSKIYEASNFKCMMKTLYKNKR